MINLLIKIAWIIIGASVFEGVWWLMLINLPWLCYPPENMFQCTGSFFFGSAIFILIGGIVGLILPRRLFKSK